ncbi:GerMN domain-containing protein [[Clostridium] scindens]|uniref:GerMN domain-containing protein n=1 Tax=Clostridium scindens (strain JCM 10418 / VPI 12708) TaxID=29347 RepID=UPI0022E7D44A|nr:GerMN domain-containing protein [[Clostridium] scindens]
MKYKIRFGIIIIALLLLMNACSKEVEDQEMPKDSIDIHNEKQNKAKEDRKGNKENQATVDMPKEEQDNKNTNVSTLVPIEIYKCNDDATDFIVELAEVEAISPETILHELIDKNVLSSEIQILSFNIIEQDGKSSINLDMNDAFSNYLASLGTDGEYYTIGSICNTFLKAYESEQIKIIVNGNILVTGHTDYPDYMRWFK